MLRSLAVEIIGKIGQKVTLYGWVNTYRAHGKITFIDLRDRSGIIQTVYSGKKISLNSEDVVKIMGLVKKRPEKMVNLKIATGGIEVEIKQIEILSKAKELPFPINTDGYDIEEEIRMKYRYLDIRRFRMTRNLRLKSQAISIIKIFLTARDFIEVETPILTKTTPEGARDFLVPSRLQKGKFYALPQSPQQYKQLLMVAGLERYFQIARCFRDEDPRADRAYGEFTQLDMEMSFIEQEDILQLTEELFTLLVSKLFPNKHITCSPWPRISYKEIKEKYKTDKPDLRKNKKDPNELAFAWIIDFPLFTKQTKEDFFHGSGKANFAPSHHMFTAPHPDDVPLLTTDPMRVRGLQHDLVLNGFEVGGGSIRIHQSQIQEKVFDLIGFTTEQKKQFTHMLTAFTYGVPPHGGIAPGIDRFLYVALAEPSIREVMAFPTSASGQTSVMNAPSFATDEQLDELGIKVAVNVEISDVFTKIKNFLDKHKISYQVYQHKAVYTSEEAAKIRGTILHQGAKALVMFADKKPIMLIIPADLKVDFNKFKSLFKVKDLRMATKEEVKQLTRVEVGAVPPFGHIFNIPLYIDEHLFENREIVFNAGLHTHSVQMGVADYKKISGGNVGNFSA